MDTHMLVHIARDGMEFDQLDASEIPERMRETWIVESDHYWHEGMADWALVGKRWTEFGEVVPPKLG